MVPNATAVSDLVDHMDPKPEDISKAEDAVAMATTIPIVLPLRTF